MRKSPRNSTSVSPRSGRSMSSVNQSEERKLEEAREHLARLVCDVRVPPWSLCEETISFEKFNQTLNPNVRCSLKSLEQKCLKVYAEERVKVKEVFSKLSGHISLSLDSFVHEELWAAMEYVCLSAHFIDDDWKLRKWVIKYCNVDDEKLFFSCESVVKCLKEWDIEGKVLSITDGEITDTVDVNKEDIQQQMKFPLNGQLFHVKCCSDIISRMIQKGYKMISEIIKKVKLLSWSQTDPIWYLTSSNLVKAVKLYEMGEFHQNLSKKLDVPSEDEWGKVRSMCRIADKIYDIVEGLFEIKRPTANLFLPHLLEIRAYLTQELGHPDEFAKSVARKMLKFFNDEYWKDMYLVLAIASFLDPRYKMKFIKFSSSNLERDDVGSKTSFVLETIRKVYNGYVDDNNQKLSDSSSESEDDEEEAEEGADKHAKKHCHKILGRLNSLRKYSELMQSENDQTYKSDLDFYLEESVFPWIENFSVLHWWKDNCSRYPYLSRMARDFLAFPMSVATSYEAYCTKTRGADMTFVSWMPELMNALMCTRSWKLGNKKD